MLWCRSKLEHITTAQITAKKNTSGEKNKTETMLLSQRGVRLSCVAVELFCIFSPLYIFFFFFFLQGRMVIEAPTGGHLSECAAFFSISLPQKLKALIVCCMDSVFFPLFLCLISRDLENDTW